jgi:hypothetical protein
MAGRDPLGVPVTTPVVAGQTADAPRALPAMAPVRQSARLPGQPSVGDGKRAASGTRAALVAPQDASGCPLAATPMPEAERDRVLAPGWHGALEPRARRFPHAAGALHATAAPVARGGAATVARRAPEQSGQTRPWQARRLGVRARAFAARQEQRGRQRVARAVTAINALDERPQGQPLGPDAGSVPHAAAAPLATHRVAGRGHVTVTTAGHEAVKRRESTRPATTGHRERVPGRAVRAEATRPHAVQRLGGRVEATNHPAEALCLAQGVAAYRRASLLAQGCGRVQGGAWALPPLWRQDAQRVVGRLSLVSLALRVVVWMPCVVRRHLQQADATRTGIAPGQPGRQTATPTTAMRRRAFRGVTWSRLKSAGKLHDHLTPWHDVPKRLLTRLEIPLAIDDGLVT